MKRGQRSSLCLAWWRDTKLHLSNNHREVLGRWSQAVHSGAWLEDQRRQPETERRAAQAGCKVNIFLWEDAQAAEQTGTPGMVCHFHP